MDDAPDRADDADLEDLRQRLRSTRAPRLPRGLGWERGTDPEYLADLVAHWTDAYDWRPHEERIRSWPWVLTGTGGSAVRAVHQRAADGTATAAVLLHGWPDSVLRYTRVLPLLRDVHVVVPALPGYPFAPPLTEPGMSASRMAEVVAGLMAHLGYDRYVVSGGDIGSSAAESLAAAHPDRVAALHLTDVPYTHLFSVDRQDLSEPERAYLSAGQEWQLREGAYALEQSTKPHTLAAALADSPAGLAAWIVEKLRSWSGSGGDVESVFPRADLLTWVTAYWLTGTIGTSFSPYAEEGEPVGRVDVPTAVTLFPHDLVPAPRAFAERFFDVRVWDERPDGGHFGAWEKPDAFVGGLRAALDLAT